MGILFGSCNSSPIPSPQVSPVIGEIISRDAIASTSIADNSQAIFHATGGATINNQIFTFSNGTWQNDNGESIRINSYVETKLTALYPANNGSILNNPYDNDTLQDVLIAQSTFKDQTNIQLNFRHLFSRLTLHIHSSIAEEIEAVKIEVPKVVSIDPSNGTFTTSGTHSTSPIETNTGVYSCIVPSLPDCSVKLTFKFKSDKEVTHSLTHTFVSGHKYDCHVNRPGIRNARDLIEFSKFINDPKNIGKMHPKFGEKFGDSIVYRLLADIKECELPSPIGDKTNTPFYDTFDGEGHTIFQLILPDDNTGLFGFIESGSMVTNLKIDGASTITNPTCSYIGVIASRNYGTINNCSVTNSTIHSKADGGVGAICAITTGAIVNCYSANNTIHISNTTYAGAILGSSEARIINCYSRNNTFNVSGTGNYIGSITGMTAYKKIVNIRNCYIYHTSNETGWHAAIGYTEYASIRNFYHNKGEVYGGKLGTSPQNIEIYNKDFKVNSTHISKLLNDWIDTTGKESYKEYKFNRWTIAPDGSPCFE